MCGLYVFISHDVALISGVDSGAFYSVGSGGATSPVREEALRAAHDAATDERDREVVGRVVERLTRIMESESDTSESQVSRGH